MGWRVIVGLVLLIVGMMELYSVTANKAGIKSISPGLVQFACLIWMAVGVFFIVKGTQKKDP